MKKRYIVEGMSCTACSSSVERVVRKIKGVNEANVNLIAKTLYVDFDELVVDDEQIFTAIKKAGFSASVDELENKKKEYKEMKETFDTTRGPSVKIRLIVSFSILIPLMYISMHGMFNLPIFKFINPKYNPLNFALIQIVLAIPILIVNRKFFINGIKGIIHLSLNMDTLVSLGSGASFVYGIIATIFIAIGIKNGNQSLIDKYVSNLYIDSSVMILSLITIGKALEEKAKNKTNQAIDNLKKLTPDIVNVIKDGQERETNIQELNVGDKIVVKAGESIPVDGLIIDGSAYINESAITGESIPVYKTRGDNAISASINADGYLIVEATRVRADTTINRIIECVKNAGATKARMQRLADVISMYFVPIVICLSIVAFAVWMVITKNFENSLNHGIQVLVISCPCALGLATPVAVTASIGASARTGILIKNAETFEILNRTDTIIFDKTGTLTEGYPSVVNVRPISISAAELLKYARTLESKSSHPIANAIIDYTKNIEEYESTDYKNEPGLGVECLINNDVVYAGNKEYMILKGIKIDENINFDSINTNVLIAKNAELLGIIEVFDRIKSTSKEAVSTLKEKNIYVSMLSGDSFNVCNKVKEELGVDVAYDSVLPLDKERIVSEVVESGKITAFVGDGINDSPALSKASIGIAVGNGTDIAIDSSSVVLLKNDINDIPKLIDISKRTVKIIKENLFWALIYNIICIPVAMGALSFVGVELNPMIASLAMSVSSLFVVTNALRLRKIKENKKHGNIES